MQKYNVTVSMDVTYELGLEVMASSEEEAQAKADQIAQGNSDLGEMIHSSDRRFQIKEAPKQQYRVEVKRETFIEYLVDASSEEEAMQNAETLAEEDYGDAVYSATVM